MYFGRYDKKQITSGAIHLIKEGGGENMKEQKRKQKKPYVSPKLVKYGSAIKLTRGGSGGPKQDKGKTWYC